MTEYMKSLIDRLAAAFLRYETQPAALQTRCSDILNDARSKWRAELEQEQERQRRELSEIVGSYEVVLVTADGLHCKKTIQHRHLAHEIVLPLKRELPSTVEGFDKSDSEANCYRRYRLTSTSGSAGYPEYEEVQS